MYSIFFKLNDIHYTIMIFIDIKIIYFLIWMVMQNKIKNLFLCIIYNIIYFSFSLFYMYYIYLNFYSDKMNSNTENWREFIRGLP